jgi:enamine deaminase RidA (YjgF/YER057c/UK114 family)
LKNIKAIVERVGHVMSDVVKVNIFLKDIEDSAALDEVYTVFFPGGVPARRIVGVSALPENALVQIEVVVSNAEGTPPEK